MKKMAAILIGVLLLFGAASAATTILYQVSLKENPSTGYQWFCVVSDDALLSVADHGYTPNDGSDPTASEEGAHAWTLGGLQPGIATVSFAYMRPWDLQPSDFIYSLTFEIDEGSNLSLLASEKLPEEYTPGKAMIQLIENPTTGYHWVMDMQPKGVLQVIADAYEPDAAEDGMVGSGGVHTWVLRGMEDGEARLVLRYKGPGDGDTVSAAVVVLSYIVDSSLQVTLHGIGGDYDKYTPFGRE